MDNQQQNWTFYFSNITENKSVPTFDLEKVLGPKRISFHILIPVTIVYCLIFITGVVGNIITCVVITKRNYMQTATNYYLFSLAISDLLSLILGLPQEMYSLWIQYPYIFGPVICSIRAFLSEMTSYASILTITAFTVERYIAICHPLFAQTVTTPSRAVKIIICVWIIANLTAIPYAEYTTVNYLRNPNTNKTVEESSWCGIHYEKNIAAPLIQFSSFMFFVIPMSIITVLYIKIGLTLRMSGLSRTSSDNSNPSNDNSTKPRQSRKAVLKMLVAVVIAFFICWAPFHAQRLQFCYVSDWTPKLKDINTHLYYVAGCFYYFNSTVNPILYNVMSRKYRSAFLETLGCHQRRSYNTRSHGSGYSTTLSSMNNRSGWKDMKSEKANSESSSKSGQHNGACLIFKKSTDSDNNWQITSKPSSVGLTATSAMINDIEKVNCKSSQSKKSVPVFSTVPQSYLKNLKSAETFL